MPSNFSFLYHYDLRPGHFCNAIEYRIRAMCICYNRFPRIFSLDNFKDVETSVPLPLCKWVRNFLLDCQPFRLETCSRLKKSNFPNLFKSTPSSQSATKRAFNEVIEIKSLTGKIGTRQITLCNANWILLVHVTQMSSPRSWEVHAMPAYKTYRMR